ncbi:MAG: hypothetical protein Q7S53_03590 [bacterium]|nr:hypothetical protein [bacterium]
MMYNYDSYQNMMGGSYGGAMIFMWIGYILVIVALILGIAALWKYINKK